MSDKKHGNMLINLFNELKKIQDMVEEYSPADDKSGEEPEDKEDDTAEDVIKVKIRSLSLEKKASVSEIKELGYDLYSLLSSFGDSREMGISKLKLDECVMWAIKGVCRGD